jgi:hypothetical protein
MKQSAKNLNLSSDELLEEIAKYCAPFPARPKGFGITIAEYCKKTGCADTTARRIMYKLKKSGVLQVQKMLENDHIINVYFK